MFAKIFTIIGVCAATTLALEFDLSETVNKTLEFVDESSDYIKNQTKIINKNKKDYKRQLVQILDTAEQEIQRNYGKIVQPVAEDYAAFLKTLEVNANCDEHCVAQVCFTPANWAMNWTCVVNTCQCSLKNPTATQAAAQDLKSSVRNITNHVVPSYLQEKTIMINEAYRAYRLKQVAVINTVAQDVKKQIVSAVPEAADCFDYCQKYYGTSLPRYVPCLGQCYDNFEQIQAHGGFQ